MKRRVLWISVACVIFGYACASAPVPPIAVNHFDIDSAFVDMLAEYREILPTERVLCLYGAVRGDTAYLNFAKPTIMRARSQHFASYEPCPSSQPTLTANYLGTWHNHKVDGRDDDLCRFSETDDASFNTDPRALIELMSCRGRLMARSKYK